jgi:hypothetical protein
MDNKLIEEVAKAIYENRPGPDGLEFLDEEPWRSCIDAAIAAIDVIRRYKQGSQ